MSKQTLYRIRDSKLAWNRLANMKALRLSADQDSILRNDLLARLLIRLNERDAVR